MKDFAWVVGIIAAIAALGVGGFVIGGGLDSADFLTLEREPPAEWDPILEPYIEFIEAERGLEFEHPVHVRFTDISAEVAENLEAYRAAEAAVGEAPETLAFADPYGEAYKLLGLVEFDESSDAQTAGDEAIAENAGAFYDSESIEIVLPEGEDEAALRITIVHELVHALQDQNGLLGGGRFDSPDASQARLALIEGDAERIAFAWFATQTPREQQEYFDAIDDDPDTPFVEESNTYLESTFFASYSIGPPLVETIIATDGIDALEALMRADDIGTTERFIDPLGASETSSVDAYSEIDLPDSVNYADGDLGALGWFAALAPSVGTESAFDALIGYDDDAFAIYIDDQGVTCGRFEVFFDDDEEAGEFNEIAVGLLGDGVGDVEGSRVTFDLCSPVGDPDDQTPSTVFPLVVANELTLHHLWNGESEEAARCAARAQASTISATEPIASFAGYDVLLDDAAQFVANCTAG